MGRDESVQPRRNNATHAAYQAQDTREQGEEKETGSGLKGGNTKEGVTETGGEDSTAGIPLRENILQILKRRTGEELRHLTGFLDERGSSPHV